MLVTFIISVEVEDEFCSNIVNEDLNNIQSEMEEIVAKHGYYLDDASYEIE